MPNAYVIGLGRSGIAAAKLLSYQGWQVTIGDRADSDGLRHLQQQLATEGIAVRLGDNFDPDREPDLNLIVVSPGVPWDVPALVRSRQLGIETIGEMELAWRHLQSVPWVAVTGTNGKTTTTALVAAIFQMAGFEAPACGNIGNAACELALEVSQSQAKFDWIIAEISSYQIESSATIAPEIGIWTTFTPDHLQRHYTLDNYFQIKARLLEKSRDRVLNGDDPYLQKNCADKWQNPVWTATQKEGVAPNAASAYIEGDWICFRGETILPLDIVKMPGDHNKQNLLMAVAAAKLAGIEKDAIATAIAEFPGVPHRLEIVRTWQDIEFVNDSKATNYDAADVGLRSVASPVILIAGGQAKEGDDRPWLQTIQAKAAAVLLIGEAAPTFAKRLQEVGYTNYEIVGTMEKAVPRGAQLAKETNAKTVLLSPACASFDSYANFEERGDRFRQLCLELY